MPKINISIPQPCSENWDIMSPEDKGRFCNSCQKKVFDFTQSSDREIVATFQQNKNLCGRFLDSQLNRDLIKPEKKNPVWMATTSTMISLIGLGTNESSAQATNTVKTEQTKNTVWLGKPAAPKVNTNPKTHDAATIPDIEISGIVKDASGVLPGAAIFIKGTNKSTKTDFDGNFSLKAKAEDLIIVSFIGLENFEFKINPSKIYYEIILKEPVSYTKGEYPRVILGVLKIVTKDGIERKTESTNTEITRKRTFFGRIFHSIGNLFR